MKWEKFSGWLALFIMGIGMLFCLQILQGKWGEWGVVPDSQQIQGVYKAEKEEAPVIEVLEKTWTAQSVVSVKEMVRAREYDGTDLTEKVKVQIQGQAQADTFWIKKEGDYQAQAVVVSDKTGLRTEKKFQIVIEEGGKSEIR